MPLPLIIGAAALVAGAYGAKKGYDGHKKHSEADDIVKHAKSRYDRKKSEFDKQQGDTELALGDLGSLELEIGKSFGEFKTIADSLLIKLNEGKKNKLEVHVPKHTLQKLKAIATLLSASWVVRLVQVLLEWLQALPCTVASWRWVLHQQVRLFPASLVWLQQTLL
jgi:hypothetical protein